MYLSRILLQLFTFGLMVCFSACKKQENKTIRLYKGPTGQMKDIETVFSEHAIVRVKLNAATQYEYENGDRFFPDGIFITFYDSLKAVSSTLTANQGRLEKKTSIYTAIGNVEIKGMAEKKKLNTELLHWDPVRKKVFTDKYVRIETTEEILTGNGLDASQDFKTYRILHPAGIFGVKK